MYKTVEHVMPKVGTVYEKKYKGKLFKLTVVRASGKTAFDYSGQAFDTPTAAAKTITKHEINGWKFWGIDQTSKSTRKGRPWSVTVRRP